MNFQSFVLVSGFFVKACLLLNISCQLISYLQSIGVFHCSLQLKRMVVNMYNLGQEQGQAEEIAAGVSSGWDQGTGGEAG